MIEIPIPIAIIILTLVILLYIILLYIRPKYKELRPDDICCDAKHRLLFTKVSKGTICVFKYEVNGELIFIGEYTH